MKDSSRSKQTSAAHHLRYPFRENRAPQLGLTWTHDNHTAEPDLNSATAFRFFSCPSPSFFLISIERSYAALLAPLSFLIYTFLFPILPASLLGIQARFLLASCSSSISSPSLPLPSGFRCLEPSTTDDPRSRSYIRPSTTALTQRGSLRVVDRSGDIWATVTVARPEPPSNVA